MADHCSSSSHALNQRMTAAAATKKQRPTTRSATCGRSDRIASVVRASPGGRKRRCLSIELWPAKSVARFCLATRVCRKGLPADQNFT